MRLEDNDPQNPDTSKWSADFGPSWTVRRRGGSRASCVAETLSPCLGRRSRKAMAIGPFKKAKSAHALLTSLKTLKMSRTEDGYDDYVNKFQDILNSLDPDDQPNNISKCCDFVNGLGQKARVPSQTCGTLVTGHGRTWMHS
jgi:hypothetical protein